MRAHDASHLGALQLAVDLVQLPSQIRSLRAVALPSDILVLLRIAAGDEEVTTKAAETTGRSRDVIRTAAAFFIEQILLDPHADSYRVLGATPEASYPELRRNMALLLRWLHPDSDHENQRGVFAARVTSAWNDLKTKERRDAYDRLQRLSKAKRSVGHTKHDAWGALNRHGPNRRWNYHPPSSGHRPRNRPMRVYSGKSGGILRRILLQLFGRSTV